MVKEKKGHNRGIERQRRGGRKLRKEIIKKMERNQKKSENGEKAFRSH
jgi:hypothetical protein